MVEVDDKIVRLGVGTLSHRIHVERVTGRIFDPNTKRIEKITTLRNGGTYKKKICKWVRKKGKKSGRFGGAGWWGDIGEVSKKIIKKEIQNGISSGN